LTPRCALASTPKPLTDKRGYFGSNQRKSTHKLEAAGNVELCYKFCHLFLLSTKPSPPKNDPHRRSYRQQLACWLILTLLASIPYSPPDPTFQIGKGCFVHAQSTGNFGTFPVPLTHTAITPFRAHRHTIAEPTLSFRHYLLIVHQDGALNTLHTGGPVICCDFWTLLLLKGRSLMESTRVKNKMLQNWNKCWPWTWKTLQWNVKRIMGNLERCDISLSLRHNAQERYRTDSHSSEFCDRRSSSEILPFPWKPKPLWLLNSSACKEPWIYIKMSPMQYRLADIYRRFGLTSNSRITTHYLDDGDIRFVRSSDTHLPDYAAGNPRRQLPYPLFVLSQINNYHNPILPK